MSKSETEETEVISDFGSVLAKARKTRNASVEQVSEYLKIPGKLITAIEENDIDELPPPTFTQGYIRAYARYLELPVNDVLDIYNQAVPHEDAAELKHRTRLPDETNSQSPLVRLVTILLILSGIAAVVYGSYDYYQKKAGVMETELEPRRPGATGNTLDSPAMQATQTLEIKQDARLTDDGELVLGKQAGDMSGEAAFEKSAADNEVTPPSEEAGPQAVSSDIIEFYAENGAWLEVYDASDDRLFYNMLPEDGNKTLQGQAPFRIALGNADSTRIMLNNIEVDMTNYIRRNNTASFTLRMEGQDVVITKP